MIFVDTSALFAVADVDDAAHSQATAVMRSLASDDADLVTTNYVVLELLSLVQRRLGMRVVSGITNDLLPGIDIACVTDELHVASVEFFLGENRRQLSLVDCSSIVFMRRRKITRAFAYDADFKHFGIELLN
jgi:uncharacterized protein